MQGSTGNLERTSGPTHAALTRGTVGAAPAGHSSQWIRDDGSSKAIIAYVLQDKRLAPRKSGIDAEMRTADTGASERLRRNGRTWHPKRIGRPEHPPQAGPLHMKKAPLPEPNQILWWRRRGSNPRPPRCDRGALPAELRPQDK